VRPKTLAGYRDALRPVIATYGGLAVQRVTKQHLDDLVALLVAGKLTRSDGRPIRPWKPRTVNLMLFLVRTVLDDLVRQGQLVRNVAVLVDRLPQIPTEMQTYTPDEVRAVLAAARGDRLEAAWHLALCGLRRGETCGIRWSDLDLEVRTVTIRETQVVIDGTPVESTPKSARGNRTLPLTDALVDVLKRAQEQQDAERRAAGPHYTPSGYLVVDELGRRLHPETVSARWDQLAKVAGVRRIRLHDARHTCGTLMHLHGVPVAVISAWLGHADPAFTMRTYVHAQNDALGTAANALSDLMD
jgi:integrase